MDLSERSLTLFRKKIQPMSNGCAEWTGAINSSGYSSFGVRENGKVKTYLAHRISYQLYVGEIPDGLVLDHLCRNRKCVNPKHLRVTTNRENLLCGNSFSGLNFRKTHCKHGHKFTKENTIIAKREGNGLGRRCRACRNRYDSNRVR